MREQCEVVFNGFTETIARIDADSRPANTNRYCCVNAINQIVSYFCQHIIVMGRQLHALRVTLHMHDTERALTLADCRQAIRITKTTNVIDHIGTRCQYFTHHGGVTGIDRQGLTAFA